MLMAAREFVVNLRAATALAGIAGGACASDGAIWRRTPEGGSDEKLYQSS
jgi:hypothetical protein